MDDADFPHGITPSDFPNIVDIALPLWYNGLVKGGGFMKIYFVRHGHPDYKNDCLTEIGHKQAQAAAKRLAGSKITEVYSSTKGRAMETAEYTAKQLGLEVVPCDFIREISWKSIDGEPIPENGHPWRIADLWVSENKSLKDDDWQTKEPYSKSVVVDYDKSVSAGIDEWLEELGYKREGEYYRVIGENTNKNVAMFSHGGSSSVALAHMLNIPLPLFFGAFRLGFTAITVIKLPDTVGELCCPQLRLFNDVAHTDGLDTENVFDN